MMYWREVSRTLRHLLWMPLLWIGVVAAQMPYGPGGMSPEQMQQYMQQRGYGYGQGGMMGGGPGYGGGMMGGMMDMMMGGGGMMGPGMMGGGMMGGGYGYGPGMMGDGDWAMGPLYALDLTDDQRDKIEKIRDAERRKHWDIAGKIQDAQAKLRDRYLDDNPDPKKVGAAWADISRLQQQMVELHVAVNNDITKLLTAEQREQLKQFRRGGYGGGYGPGMGGPRGGMMGR